MPMPPAAGPGAPLASPAAPARRSGLSALHVVLAFLSGMLLMTLAAIGLWLQQRPQQRISTRPQPPASAPGTSAGLPTSPVPAAAVPTPKDQPDAPAPEPENQPAQANGSGSAADPAALDRSLASVNALYAALSAKDYGRARSLIGAAAADQFDPAFFDQFARVTVQDLRLTSQSGSTVNLEGVVSFVYPDGTIQTETRTFSLDSSSEPPLITASEFGRVIKPR
jgi:hypothetical protein